MNFLKMIDEAAINDETALIIKSKSVLVEDGECRGWQVLVDLADGQTVLLPPFISEPVAVDALLNMSAASATVLLDFEERLRQSQPPPPQSAQVLTIAQHVSKLKIALDKLARLGNEPEYGNSVGNVIAQEALRFVPLSSSDPNPITEYALKYYFVEPKPGLKECSLCGQTGVIHTEGQRDASGIAVGRANFCICPNGQEMRAAATTTVGAAGMEN